MNYRFDDNNNRPIDVCVSVSVAYSVFVFANADDIDNDSIKIRRIYVESIHSMLASKYIICAKVSSSSFEYVEWNRFSEKRANTLLHLF